MWALGRIGDRGRFVGRSPVGSVGALRTLCGSRQYGPVRAGCGWGADTDMDTDTDTDTDMKNSKLDS